MTESLPADIRQFVLRYIDSVAEREALVMLSKSPDFSAAFLVDAANRASIALLLPDVSQEQEPEPIFYLVRLIAFTLILIAIIDKNLRGGGKKQ